MPYLWSPQLLLARRSVYGAQPPTSLRALFSLRGAARAALPDSPLELAVAARYLGIGDPFALERDELAAAREVVAPARPLLHLYRDAAALRSLFRRGVIDLALGNPATLGDQRAAVVASLPSEGTIASERVLGVVAGTRRGGLRAARRGRSARAGRAGAAGRRARPRCRCARRPARHSPRAPARRSGGRSRGRSRTARWPIHPAASEGVTGWPEWVGEWVLLRG